MCRRVFDFLKKQLRAAIDAFYSKSKNRFHRSLLRLDGIEDYQEFLLGYEVEEAEEEDVVYLEGLEEEKQRRLDKLNNLLPSLTSSCSHINSKSGNMWHSQVAVNFTITAIDSKPAALSTGG